MIAATDFATGTALWDAVFSPTHQDKLLEFYDYAAQERLVPLTDYRNSVIGVWNAAVGQMGELARYDAEGLLTRLNSAEEIECDERTTDNGPGAAVCAPANNIPFAGSSAPIHAGVWRNEPPGSARRREQGDAQHRR